MGIEAIARRPVKPSDLSLSALSFFSPPLASLVDNWATVLMAFGNEEHVKVTAIVGSYRRGGIVESAADEILPTAKAQNAEVEKVHLLDRRVEFCTNCRTCTLEPGADRGRCTIADDVPAILYTILHACAFCQAGCFSQVFRAQDEPLSAAWSAWVGGFPWLYGSLSSRLSNDPPPETLAARPLA